MFDALGRKLCFETVRSMKKFLGLPLDRSESVAKRTRDEKDAPIWEPPKLRLLKGRTFSFLFPFFFFFFFFYS